MVVVWWWWYLWLLMEYRLGTWIRASVPRVIDMSPRSMPTTSSPAPSFHVAGSRFEKALEREASTHEPD